jgi:hypothetical protein
MPGLGRLAAIVALCAATASPCFALSRSQASGDAKADPDAALSRAFDQLTSTVDVAQDRPAVTSRPTVTYDLSAPRDRKERHDGYEQLSARPSDPALNPFLAPLAGRAEPTPAQ